MHLRSQCSAGLYTGTTTEKRGPPTIAVASARARCNCSGAAASYSSSQASYDARAPVVGGCAYRPLRRVAKPRGPPRNRPAASEAAQRAFVANDTSAPARKPTMAAAASRFPIGRRRSPGRRKRQTATAGSKRSFLTGSVNSATPTCRDCPSRTKGRKTLSSSGLPVP